MKKSLLSSLLVFGVLLSFSAFAEEGNNPLPKREKPNFIKACASSQENASCSYTRRGDGTLVKGTCIKGKNPRGQEVLGCSEDGKTFPVPPKTANRK